MNAEEVEQAREGLFGDKTFENHGIVNHVIPMKHEWTETLILNMIFFNDDIAR
ncbi:hypothetical protein IscW_ISCW009530 [Ixodes scapularis]|uniref:Uncharacterized protein n=1 Tax=Ixodes scapularis TaxID=6945 RepID=B7Q2K6_IXOSC|nr:hypothetical protein IscW_ISCW009530 [Ixodes scapularis]|eukprot:XP_002410870.1 hypothetical protein IscW_ISCW009530 [Ixodes scapularis]